MNDEKPKRELTEKQREALAKHAFKPGVSGNPSGTITGKSKSRRISKFSQIWGQATAPDNWFEDCMSFAKSQGLTVDELIVIRMKYCLANNVKYQNTALLKEMYDRYEGKIPLRVLNRPAEEEESFDELTTEELTAYVMSIEARAISVALEKQEQNQLTEGIATVPTIVVAGHQQAANVMPVIGIDLTEGTDAGTTPAAENNEV